ncbi:MAG: hypothetical protein C4334_01685 [Pyrinomonas sp.]
MRKERAEGFAQSKGALTSAATRRQAGRFAPVRRRFRGTLFSFLEFEAELSAKERAKRQRAIGGATEDAGGRHLGKIFD